MAEPDRRKLSEQLRDTAPKEVEKEVKKKEDEISRLKKQIFRQKVKFLVDDFRYVFVVSLMLGFALWAFFPEEFSVYKSIGLGLIWYLLFSDLNLQNIFKK